VDEGGRLGVTWTDQRNSNIDIYAQLIDRDGTRRFDIAGAALSEADNMQSTSAAAFDGKGGLVAAFVDERMYYHDQVRMQRIDPTGYLGDPAPTTLSAVDAPQDQGGVVLLDWERSWLDDPYEYGLNSYTVWNRYAGAKSAATAGSVAGTIPAAGLPEDLIRAQLQAGWTYVGEVPAQEFEIYGYNAPTFADSTEAGVPLTEFQVVAVGLDGEYWHSNVVSGYSVDNLPPGAPLMLAAELDGIDVDLDWSPSGLDDEDLAEYRVYRADTPGVVPGPDTFVGVSADTLFTDPAPPAGPQHYVVTAVDVHDNEGAPSNEAMVDSVTLVGDGRLPEVFTLHAAMPNPFNPATRIMLDMPSTGMVRVEIFDARGARLRVLHDGALTAGRHELRWDGDADDGRALPSGIYLARAVGGRAVSTVKLVLAR